MVMIDDTTGILQPFTELMNLRDKPRFTKAPFQLQDLAYLSEDDRSEATANWSEMGCFKTTTALWHMENLKAKKVLIVTTQTGKGPYFKTIPELFPKVPFHNVNMKQINPREEWMAPTAPIDPKKLPDGIYIAHYNVFLNEPIKKNATLMSEMMPRPRAMAKILMQNTWDMLIIDEAHRMKDPQTQWTQNLKAVRASHRHIMTGTGFINQPLEVWSLLNFLDPDEFPNIWAFRTWMTRDEWQDGKRVTVLRPERIDKYKSILRKYGVRRTKTEVFKDLPSLYPPEIIEVELNSTQRTMYEDIKNELAALDQNGTPYSSPNVLSALQRMRQIAVATPQVDDIYMDTNAKGQEVRRYKISLQNPSSKLDALMTICKELEWDDERKDQMVVFTMFNDVIKLAKERFDKMGISYIHLKATDTADQRFAKERAFVEQKAQIFISTIKLGGEAISLQDHCSRVCFLDRSWSPGDNNQAIARVWRPGQTERVQVFMVEAIDTVDQVVEERLQIKQHWFDLIFGDWKNKKVAA